MLNVPTCMGFGFIIFHGLKLKERNLKDERLYLGAAGCR